MGADVRHLFDAGTRDRTRMSRKGTFALFSSSIESKNLVLRSRPRPFARSFLTSFVVLLLFCLSLRQMVVRWCVLNSFSCRSRLPFFSCRPRDRRLTTSVVVCF